MVNTPARHEMVLHRQPYARPFSVNAPARRETSYCADVVAACKTWPQLMHTLQDDSLETDVTGLLRALVSLPTTDISAPSFTLYDSRSRWDARTDDSAPDYPDEMTLKTDTSSLHLTHWLSCTTGLLSTWPWISILFAQLFSSYVATVFRHVVLRLSARCMSYLANCQQGDSQDWHQQA